MIRYACTRAVLPVVEAALAANGYILQRPHSGAQSAKYIAVMMRAGAVVLLSEHEQSEVADIKVFGADPAGAAELLETLPLGLAQQSQAGNEQGVRRA